MRVDLTSKKIICQKKIRISALFLLFINNIEFELIKFSKEGEILPRPFIEGI